MPPIRGGKLRIARSRTNQNACPGSPCLDSCPKGDALLEEKPDGLYCSAGSFYIDPWGPVQRAVITHAHGDHARPGAQAYLCAAPTMPLLRKRFGSDVAIESIP